MDIRDNNTNQQDTKLLKQQESRPTYAATQHITSTAEMLPEFVKVKLKQLTAQYNLPCDLSTIQIEGGTMAEKIKQLRGVIELIEGDSKLLPEMLKLIKRLMRAEIKQAQFYRDVTKASLKHQKKLDKVTADMFLQMVGYSAKSETKAHITNQRASIIEKREVKKREYYANSVYAGEVELIDSEFELLASNQQALTAGKTQNVTDIQTARKESKQRVEQYVKSALID